MVAPTSIDNDEGESLDTIFNSAGVARLKGAVGEYTLGSLTPNGAGQLVGTHQNEAVPGATDAYVAILGWDGTVVRRVAVTASGRVLVSSVASAVLIGTGHINVAVTSTAIALKATTACTKVAVKADTGNAATLYIGISTVTSDETAATGGLQLEPGEGVEIEVANLATVFINGTAGDGASFMWWA